MQVSFKLTALGGAAWEKVAEADWQHMVYDCGDLSHEELISASRDRLIAYMGWYPEIYRKRIQLETVTWQMHTEFEVLYWKRLPFVYHVSFGAQSANPRWRGTEPKWFSDWRSRVLSWHKEPWDLPDWPSE